MTALSTADIFRRAAQVIKTNGWHQGWFYDEEQWKAPGGISTECRVCLMGALNMALGRRPDASTYPSSGFAARLGQQLGLTPLPLEGMVGAVIQWNDMAGREVNEVLEALESAAVLAEQDGAQ